MLINLAELKRTTDKAQTYQFCEPCQPLTMGADLLTIEDGLNVCLNIALVDNTFIVKGTIQTQIKVACARCLEDFIDSVHVAFEDEWFSADDLPEHLHGIPDTYPDDIYCLKQEEPDITERIMEHFIVNLPMRFICSDNCRGLCPQCGNNLNNSPCACQHQAIDPRLAALARWETNTAE
ncbi:MAG: DUF177 domain-containing protein [Gracilibacteraceae bacterium]|jgi:uncharacterized protein|nr:DUF177 domain-containing protein [Gracilibacteraceae bacterium]